MTKAIILAAGQGTRLRPHTDHIPKTMVALNGKPIVEYQREVLSQAGIHEIHVVVGYKQDKIDGSKFQKHLNPEFDKTNMVSSLYCAKALFDGSSNILITYGDIIYEPQVVQNILSQHGNQISIIYDTNWLNLWKLRMDNPLDDAESFQLDSDGNVADLGRKETDLANIQGQYTGLIYVKRDFAPHFFDLFEQLRGSEVLFDGKDFDNMYMTTYLRMQIQKGVQVKGVKVHGGWIEIDSTEDLEIYSNMINKGQLEEFCSILKK